MLQNMTTAIQAAMPPMPPDRAGDKIKDMALGVIVALVGLGCGVLWFVTHQTGLTLLLVGLGVFAVGAVMIDKEAVVGAVKALLALVGMAKSLKDGAPPPSAP